MRSFRLLFPYLFVLFLAACQTEVTSTTGTPTSEVPLATASVTPVPTSAATAAPLPTPTLTPLPLYPFDPGPTPEFDPTTNRWIVTDQQGQKWMLDAAINIWGKPGEAIVLDGQLLVWDQQVLAYIDSGVSAASGERVEVSNGQFVWAAYTVVSGQPTLTAVVLASGEVVGAEGGLVWTGTVNPDGTLSDATPASLMYWDAAEQRLVQAEVDSSVVTAVNAFISGDSGRSFSVKMTEDQGAGIFYQYEASDSEGQPMQRDVKKWAWNMAENRLMQVFDLTPLPNPADTVNFIRSGEYEQQDLYDLWQQMVAAEWEITGNSSIAKSGVVFNPNVQQNAVSILGATEGGRGIVFAVNGNNEVIVTLRLNKSEGNLPINLKATLNSLDMAEFIERKFSPGWEKLGVWGGIIRVETEMGDKWLKLSLADSLVKLIRSDFGYLDELTADELAALQDEFARLMLEGSFAIRGY